MPERAWLERTAEVGVAHRRLPRLAYAERSPSGRARCRQCRTFVEQGVWRLALQMYEEGRFAPIGFIHLTCAEPYFETRDLLDQTLDEEAHADKVLTKIANGGMFRAGINQKAADS